MNRKFIRITYFLILIWSVLALNLNARFAFLGEDAKSNMFDITSIALQFLIEGIILLFMFAKGSRIVTAKIGQLLVVWLAFVVLNSIINYSGFVDFITNLRIVLWWPLIYFLFYLIFQNDRESRSFNLLIKCVPYLFCVQLIIFLYYRSLDFKKAFFSDVLQSNSIYYLPLLIPLMVFIRNKGLKYVLLLLAVVSVFISFKRSALIFTTLVVLIIIYRDFMASSKGRRFKSFIMIALFTGAVFFSFQYSESLFGSIISTRMESMNEDEGSGRLPIYASVWSVIINRDIALNIFGAGTDAVRGDNVYMNFSGSSLSAHNDFLECLYDYGFVGLLLYLMIIYRVIRLTLSINRKTELSVALMSAFVIFIVMSMVSHLLIYPTYFAYLVIVWAYAEAITSKQKRGVQRIISKESSIIYRTKI